MEKSLKTSMLSNIFKANILLGALAFIGAVYLMIVGDYANLALRQQTESILNAVSIGGLIYSVLFWYLDLYFNPTFPVSEN